MGRAEVSVSDWKTSISSSTEPSSSNSPSPVAEIRKESRVDAPGRQKRSQRKKQTSTGSWPCKIHGCNAQFAREADLKRHQRTTKQHSMPSFSCPQCDASFTRTDALRRHQKSRHDGVVVEPMDGPKEDGKSGSRAGSPSSSNNDKSSVGTLPVQVTQGNPTHIGSSSYYRSHTANISPYIPQRLQQLSRSSQITHPISAARTAPWPIYVPVWHNGPLPQNFPSITYVPHPMYQPSPHYRPHTGAYPPVPPPRPPDHVIPCDLPENPHALPLLEPDSATAAENMNNEIQSGGLPLEKELTADDVVAVLEAALRQAASQSRSGSEGDGNSDEYENQFSPADSIVTGSLDHQMEEELMGLCVLSDYGSERVLMEVGNTILNTDELLTQDSPSIS